MKSLLKFEKQIFGTYFYFDKLGFWFLYKGDEVGWIYPWNRPSKNKKWISLGFSGNGEFGDAYFGSLKELDEMWNSYNDMLDKS